MRTIVAAMSAVRQQARIRALGSAFVLLLIGGAIQPAAAEQQQDEREQIVPLGSRIPRWEERPLAAHRDAMRVLRSFARCIVRTQPDRAAELLRTPPASTAQTEVVDALVARGSACLNARRMTLTPPLLRGAIAEALIVRDRLTEAPLAPTSVAEDFAAFSARIAEGAAGPITPSGASVLVGRWLAFCLAHEQPVLIRAVLDTDLGSNEERQALRASSERLSSCLLQGQVLEVDQLTMRALLAEAYYQRSVGGVPQSGAERISGR